MARSWMARFCLMLLFGVGLWAAADPFVGVWKLDTLKSVFPEGAPSFLLGTFVVEADGSNLKSHAFNANEDGFASTFLFDCSMDGTPCKLTTATPQRGSSAIDAISLKRIDTHTITASGLKDGKVVYSDRRSVSADGKTMTVNRHGRTPSGSEYDSVIVLVHSAD